MQADQEHILFTSVNLKDPLLFSKVETRIIAEMHYICIYNTMGQC